MLTTSSVIDLLGWLGAAAVLAAYAMISTHRVQAASLKYQGLNLFGGALLAVNTGYYKAYPSTLVNVIWMGIALYTLSRWRQPGRES